MHWSCCIKASCESGVGGFGGWLAAVGFPEARLRSKLLKLKVHQTLEGII